MDVDKKDLIYLFDAIWFGFSYETCIEFREKLHELFKKYKYEYNKR